MTSRVTPDNSARWESWYWFLRQSLKVGLPFNEKAYSGWGTRAEIETWGFKKWWQIRGREIARQSVVSEPEIVEQTPSTITIRFPLSMPSQLVKAKASALVARARGTKRLSKDKPNSKFNYTKIKQIQRFLQLDLDKDFGELTIEEKGLFLGYWYHRIGEMQSKAIQTYRKKAEALQRAGDKESAGRYRRRAIKLEEYKSKNTDNWFEGPDKQFANASAEKLGRWAIQGRIILMNVARGEFPGSNWYGSRRYASYKQRLKEFGIQTIGTTRPERSPRGTRRKTRKTRRS